MTPLELIADRNLLAPSSFEIEGMIKIQPLADVEEKVLSSWSWKKSEFFEDRCMVTNYNYGGPEESQIQMYYEFGIFSTIYKGTGLPNWFWYTFYKPSISFTIPSHPNKLKGLNFCHVGKFFNLPMVKIRNITKNHTWIYKHCIESFSIGGESLVFLSRWMFGMNEMEVDDEVTISLEKFDGYRIYCSGMSLVYGEKEDPLGSYKSWNHIIGGDLSAFQLTSGEYFLNSVDFLRSSFFNAHYKGRYSPAEFT
ncbi:hypothetical protein HanOQP8_Chr00c025g0717511 [Helianthus annuus]|nr:hypothetical protein HanOQP8_Chr00c025g0717511 [Helianthus annuus]